MPQIAEVSILSTTRRVNDIDINELMTHYEMDDFFQYWVEEVARGFRDGMNTGATVPGSTGLPGSRVIFDKRMETLRRHFPRGNFLKRIVQRMAYSLPDFDVMLKEADGSKCADAKQAEFQTWLHGKFAQSGWEGDSDFEGAWSYWRELLFLTGKVVVKHVATKGANGKIIDKVQRVPQLGVNYRLEAEDRKTVSEWRFQYLSVGGIGVYSGHQALVIETVNAKEWKLSIYGGLDVAKFDPNKLDPSKKPETETITPIPANLEFIPISYMAWEKLEAEPLGNPYGRRILKKILNLLSILVDIRNANRKNSDPIKVIINGDLAEGTVINAGATVRITPKIPGTQADLKLVGGDLKIESLFMELKAVLSDLYEDASLPPPNVGKIDLAETSSGKALEVLSAPMVEYRNAYLPTEKGFLQDMIWKMARIEGRNYLKDQISIQHDSVVLPNQKAKQDDASFFAEYDFIEEALRRKGVEEDRIPQLLQERSDNKAMNLGRAIALNGSLPPPSPPTQPAVKGGPALPPPKAPTTGPEVITPPPAPQTVEVKNK